MTKRAYIDCPIMALHARRNHEGFKRIQMRCQVAGDYEIKTVPEWIILRDIRDTATGNKYYIHPDDLHELEPQVGDAMLCEIYDGAAEYIQAIGIMRAEQRLFIGDEDYTGMYDLEQIIQRNNKPFPQIKWEICDD